MSSQAVHDSPAIRQYSAPNDKPIDLAHSHGRGSAHVHITPPLLLLTIYSILVVATVVTVAVTYVELGSLNIWVALGIAVFKAGLVAFYFMHLRWDSPFNGIILLISFFFVALFIGISVLDTKEYQQNYTRPGVTLRP